jgi:hypothetical protein
MAHQRIMTPVGTLGVQSIDFDLFSDIHEMLAVHLRALGFEGDDLDVAICRALPHALEAALLFAERGTVH